MQLIALIPAYNPSNELVHFVRKLADTEFVSVIIVNDGSAKTYDPVFAEIALLKKVILLRHAVNLGKGAALKTGLNHVYCYFPDCLGVVTLDADGQHLVEDAVHIGNSLRKHPENLILGTRAFDKDVPLRSRFGNNLTRHLFRLVIGQKLSDTQSGLRTIPRNFIPSLLKIPSNGYEFELDMLLSCKYSGRLIFEELIQTVYIDGNKSSHFNPFIDSMKIYFVMFRFTLASLLSALIDNMVFILVYHVCSSILTSQISARVLATTFNYFAVKRFVFYSDRSVATTLTRYLLLVCVSGFISYLLIKVLTSYFPLSVIQAKICAESIVFLANFAIQRDFIFTRKNNALGIFESNAATD